MYLFILCVCAWALMRYSVHRKARGQLEGLVSLLPLCTSLRLNSVLVARTFTYPLTVPWKTGWFAKKSFVGAGKSRGRGCHLVAFLSCVLQQNMEKWKTVYMRAGMCVCGGGVKLTSFITNTFPDNEPRPITITALIHSWGQRALA